MTIVITPRRMQIDFSEAPVHWAREPEFAAIMNASSPLASAFEPYLNSVIAKVRDVLPDDHAGVKRNIDLFIAQEGHHYRVHNGFNKRLYAAYPALKGFEQDLARELKEQFTSRSLDFNMAFCVGFENVACYLAKFTFDKGMSLYDGADDRVRSLFLWHNAEEFEHRTACNDAFSAMGGSYPMRIRGLIALLRIMMRYHNKMQAYILEIDRAGMDAAELRRSRAVEKRIGRMAGLHILPRLTQVLVPGYDPERQTASPLLFQTLSEVEGRWVRKSDAQTV